MVKLRRTGISLFPAWIFLVWLAGLMINLYFAAAFADHSIFSTHFLSNWDQGWYRSIVVSGYHLSPGQSNVAFFPLYPAVVWVVTKITGLGISAAGLLVSLVSFGLALQLAYRLALSRLDHTAARATVTLLAFFPFSFFFATFYTESLFLLLLAATLWFVDQRKWWLAAIAAGLASATRLVGILLVMVVAYEFIRHHRTNFTRKRWAQLAGCSAVGSSGLLAFVLYLKLKTGDGLAFLTVQKYWPGRGQGLRGFLTIAHNLHHGHVFSNPYALNLIEIACILLFAGLGAYCFIAISRVWGTLSLLMLLVPLATGTTISANRYVIVLLPSFVALGSLLRSPALLLPTIAISASLLSFFLNLFVSTQIFIG